MVKLLAVRKVYLLLFFVLMSAHSSAKLNNVDGVNYPSGRIPQKIINNQYPHTYFPNTEKLGQDEMRITALGTGMPIQSPSNRSSSYMVELGNGDSFLFDLGTGSTDRLSGLEVDYAKLDKIFVSHLHSDHISDLAALWISGWLSGRYTPIHVYGPSGSEPKFGTAHLVKHTEQTWTWDITTRSGTLPDAGGKLIAHEFDYSKTHVVYDKNGVQITAFPAVHIMNGPVSYRLTWKGLSFVYAGDSTPNKWFIEQAMNSDVVVHEAFFTPEQWQRITGHPYDKAYWITSLIHTPPQGFGKLMNKIKPRMAVATHYWNHRDIEFDIHHMIRSVYQGPLTMAKDLTVFNVTKDHIEVREASIDHSAWGQGTSKEWDNAPRGPVGTERMSSWLKEGRLDDYVPPPNEPDHGHLH